MSISYSEKQIWISLLLFLSHKHSWTTGLSKTDEVSKPERKHLAFSFKVKAAVTWWNVDIQKVDRTPRSVLNRQKISHFDGWYFPPVTHVAIQSYDRVLFWKVGLTAPPPSQLTEAPPRSERREAEGRAEGRPPPLPAAREWEREHCSNDAFYPGLPEDAESEDREGWRVKPPPSLSQLHPFQAV